MFASKKGLLVVLGLLLVFGCAGAGRAADFNQHMLDATLVDCGCWQFRNSVTLELDWFCRAWFEVEAPAPHFGPGNPTVVYAEITGQALGQCAEIYPRMPQEVRLLFWLQNHYVDYIHGGLVLSPVVGYYLIDRER